MDLELELVAIKDIATRSVLLMDPILGTGNSASRAIQILKEKGVKESRILFLSLIAAPEGIHKIFREYPLVKIITSEIDANVDEYAQVIPGLGEFGDRYFCDWSDTTAEMSSVHTNGNKILRHNSSIK